MIYCARGEKDMYSEASGWRSLPTHVPSVVFKTRVRDPEAAGPNPFRWEDVSTWDLFAGKRVVLFSLPGAFTPTCSTFQLPSFDQRADDFYLHGIDDIYCVSVNDAFVMNAWFKEQGVKNVVAIPDGSCKFTEAMQMEIRNDKAGFGNRSWRYACIVDNGRITDWFIEEGKEDDCSVDPYLFTDPDFILRHGFDDL